MTRYRQVAARKAEGFPTTASCDVAGVSHQAFYDWTVRQKAGPCPAELAEAELVWAIKQVHAGAGGACGSPRVTAQLRRQGQRVNRKRVERLMRLHGICSIHNALAAGVDADGVSCAEQLLVAVKTGGVEHQVEIAVRTRHGPNRRASQALSVGQDV